MMHISPERKSIVAITLLSIVAIMIGCSSQHDRVTISEQHEYDKDGRLICRITPDGSKTKYKYNDQGLLIEIKYPDSPVRYGYDANGNRIWVQNRSGKTEYKYDAFDRLIEVVFKYSPEKKIRYEYDPWNRISAIKILEGQNVNYQVKYEYNIMGNLISIDDGSGRIEYSYHPDKGEVVRYLPNGIRTVFSYSPAGELIFIKHSDSQNSLLASYRYEYDPPGKISCVLEETSGGIEITKYEWDSRGYLKTLHLPDGNGIRYNYDAMGNRISMKDSKGAISYKYDNFGRLIKAGDTKYEWDNNGNLMTQIDKNNKIKFRYDARNLPLLVKTQNETIRYKWDGDGNMISMTKGKDVTYCLPNPLVSTGITLAEFDNTGRIKNSYLYGDTLVGQRDIHGKTKYFLEDGFNSIRHIADSNGKIIGQQDYSPFAEPVNAKSNIALDFYMAGIRYLPEIKSYALGGSLYSPQIGMLNQSYAPVGNRPQDFGNRTFGQARNLIEQGQRLPVSQGLTEKELRQLEPEYYAMIDELKNAPDIADVSSLMRLMYFGTPGLIMSHFIREGAIGASFFDRTPISGFVGALAKRAENYFSNFINSHKGGELITGQFAGLREKEDVAKGYSSLWSYLRSFGGAFAESSNLVYKPQLVLQGWVDKKGQFNFGMDWVISGIEVNVSHFFKKSFNFFVEKKATSQIERFIEGNQPKRSDHIATDEDRRKKYKDDKKPFKGPDWPDGGGGPGGSGGPFGKGGPFNDPFKSFEAKLGGIKLDAAAQFTGNLGNITGAVYDPEKQVLVLVGDENSSISIKAEDLAVALMSVYGPQPQDPQFTLDPDDPKNPRGKWLKAVYMPEQIIGGTDFGKTLFEADWLLKQYSFGVMFDKDGKQIERKSSVPGFKSAADLSFEEQRHGSRKERWNRFWIVSDDMKLKQSGKSIYFDVAKMRVQSRKIVPDPKSPQGFKDVDTEDDPIATKFANIFTELYDEIAKESPEFERVRQLAKAVAIAKWMKQEGIPIDADWVNEYANKRIETVGRISALSTQWERKSQTPFQKGNQTGILTQIHKLYLFGGVDLTVSPKYKSDDGTAKSLQKTVMAKLREKVVEPTFEIKHNVKSLRATILPVTPQGQEIWKSSPTVTVKGTKYQFNRQKDITRSVDRDGNVTDYVWNANHRLNEFKISANNGWSVLGSRKNGPSEITVTNPRQDNFLYRYSPSGDLNEILINGKRYAAIDNKGGDLTVDYGNYQERLKYDHSGHVRYERRSSDQNESSSNKPQFLYISYDKKGKITEISNPDTGSLKFSYFNGHLQSVSTPQKKVNYSYDLSTSKVNQISTNQGESVRYEYEGNTIKRIIYYDGNYFKSVNFENGRPIEVKDSNGESARYKYTAKGFLEQVVDSTGAIGSCLYDINGQIKKVNLSDGSSVSFEYEWYRSKEAKDAVLRKIKVTHATPKVVSSPITGGKSPRLDKAKDVPKSLINRLEDRISFPFKPIYHIEKDGGYHVPSLFQFF